MGSILLFNGGLKCPVWLTVWIEVRPALFISLAFLSLACPAEAQERFVYWIDDVDKTIQRGTADGSKTETVLTPRLPTAVDVAGGIVYWIDAAAGSIMSRALDGVEDDTVLSGLRFQPGQPAAIAVDPIRRSVFWLGQSRPGSGDVSIFRSSLDGGDLDTLVHEPLVFYQASLEVDVAAGKLYWVENTPGVASEQQILRSNLDGSHVETVVSGRSGIQSIAVEPTDAKMYWSDGGGIRRANLDGTGVATVLSDILASALAVDAVSRKIFYIASFSLQAVNLDGAGVQTLIADLPEGGGILPEVRSLNVNQNSGELVWINGLGIVRARNDGTDLEELVAGFASPAGVAVDPNAERIYWIGAGGEILRARLDGTGAETLGNGHCPMGSSTDLELDLTNNRMYWGINSDCGAVLAYANLDGSAMAEVPVVAGVYSFFVALDPPSERAYWSGAEGIAGVNFDGTDRAVVMGGNFCGIAVDPGRAKIYWADCTNAIRRANLDGTESENVLTGLNGPFDLELDFSEDHIYWSERHGGKIRRATFDGAEVEDLYTGLPAPARMALSFGSAASSAIGQDPTPLSGFGLSQNYPNPFESNTSISYSIPSATRVSLRVFDLLGREMAVLVDRPQTPGVYVVDFDARRLPAGMYLYVLQADGLVATRRMTLGK